MLPRIGIANGWRSLRYRGGESKKRWQSSVPAPLPRPQQKESKDRFQYPEGMVAYEEDYVQQPEYPEIDPETHQWTEHQKTRRQNILDWYKKIQDQPNVEAKTLELNMPRNYGWRTTFLEENRFGYNSEEFYKFVTKTHLVEGQLPQVYSSPELAKLAAHYAERLREPLAEAIHFELDEQSRSYEEDPEETKKSIDRKRSQSIVNQINRIILSQLGGEVEHLTNCRVDVAPKIEAFWLIGGQQPSKSERLFRKNMAKINNYRKCKKEEGEPVERPLQYRGDSMLQIRCEDPVGNFEDVNSPLCSRAQDAPTVFPYTFHPFGFSKGFNFASIIPGTWTGDFSHLCSHISFHPRHHLLDDAITESEHWISDFENALSSQAILSSFGRLFSQSLYFGFDQFSDLKYPFSSQTIITDGLKWSFAAYQLNTIHLADLHLGKNKKQNICWKTNTMNIFDEKEPNKINAETLGTLLKFYLNKPIEISTENPTPYLTTALPAMQDEIQREIIFYNYRDMVSQRWYTMDNVLTRQYPEIYDWEWIYKIKHPSRFMEPRRRFFELPEGFEGSRPYETPYRLCNPRYEGKRLKQMRAEVAERKEKERLEEAKRAEKAKYGIVESLIVKRK